MKREFYTLAHSILDEDRRARRDRRTWRVRAITGIIIGCLLVIASALPTVTALLIHSN